MTKYHAHIEYTSRDCDGQYSGRSIYQRFDEQDLNTEGPTKEWEDSLRLLHFLVDYLTEIPHPEYAGPCVITIDAPIEDAVNLYTVESSQSTAEGHRWKRAEMCVNPLCDLGTPALNRDHSAERAGY